MWEVLPVSTFELGCLPSQLISTLKWSYSLHTHTPYLSHWCIWDDSHFQWNYHSHWDQSNQATSTVLTWVPQLHSPHEGLCEVSSLSLCHAWLLWHFVQANWLLLPNLRRPLRYAVLSGNCVIRQGDARTMCCLLNLWSPPFRPAV